MQDGIVSFGMGGGKGKGGGSGKGELICVCSFVIEFLGEYYISEYNYGKIEPWLRGVYSFLQYIAVVEIIGPYFNSLAFR